jgi:hypothetical protein
VRQPEIETQVLSPRQILNFFLLSASALEIENKQLKKVTEDLKSLILKLEGRVAVLEGGKGAAPAPAKKVRTNI